MSKASTQKHRSNQSTSPTDVLHPKGRGGQRIGIEPRSGHGHGGGGGVGRHLRNRRNIDRVGVSVGDFLCRNRINRMNKFKTIDVSDFFLVMAVRRR
mgnify:CR=1 FL=1